MKSKLLKKLRCRGRNQITIHSVTTMGETIVGMDISYNEDKYSGLFDFADSEEDVLKKAENIYLKDNIGWVRKKYSVKNK